MAFCLIPSEAEKFLQKLKEGDIKPEDLADMTSAERRAFFAGFLDEENAKQVNALFEEKLLLKDQQQGMITWAKKISGITPETRNDIISRISKLDRVLDPDEQEEFLQDLANRKLGIAVTQEEAKKVYDLAKKAEDLRGDLSTKEKRIAYGNAVLDLQDYAGELKPVQLDTIQKISNVAALPKTVMSTLDFSAPFRQGWGMMSRPEFWKAFGAMFKYGFSEKNYRDLMADIVSRPSYEAMKKDGLRITNLTDKLSQREEQFMSSLLDKVPGFRGSERAYTGFLNRLRADVFDKLLQEAEMRGEDIKPGSQAGKDIASVVNMFTGSGNIGTGDRYSNVVAPLNATFFSPRKISATISMFNPATYATGSKTARLAALRQLLGSVGMTALILALASMAGAKVEWDPRSSDFGKIKIGKTRFDITGGNGTYAVLLARLFSNQTKSSTTGKISNLGEGYKPTTRFDVTTKYLRNKLSPTASLVADWLVGSDANGQPFKMTDELKNRVTPMIINDVIELIKTDPSNAIAGTLGDLFGVGVQTY